MGPDGVGQGAAGGGRQSLREAMVGGKELNTTDITGVCEKTTVLYEALYTAI